MTRAQESSKKGNKGREVGFEAEDPYESVSSSEETAGSTASDAVGAAANDVVGREVVVYLLSSAADDVRVAVGEDATGDSARIEPGGDPFVVSTLERVSILRDGSTDVDVQVLAGENT